MADHAIRKLSDREIGAVAGGYEVCKYEAAGKCYVWGSPYETMAELYESWAARGRALAEWSKNRT